MKPRLLETVIAPALVLVLAATAVSCRKPEDKLRDQTTAAINSYFAAQPLCLWRQSVQFPTHLDSNNPDTTKYDALTDEGYLTRIQGEKKTFIFGDKQVSDYDLSQQGRTIWTADPQQAGYGNFCYGHRSVASVQSATAQTAPQGNVATVAFQSAVQDAAGWVNNQKMKNAFPDVGTALGGPVSQTATLVQTSSGWQVQSISPLPGASGNNSVTPGLGPKSNDYGVVGDK